MKTRKILAIAIIAIMFLALFIGTVNAVTLPALDITSNQYSVGDKMTLDEVTSVEVGKTLQLYSVISHGNDMMVPTNPDSLGTYVDKTNVEGVTWTSSDITVATVSGTGLVTGHEAGTVTITATTTDTDADTKTANVEITVTAVTTNTDTENTQEVSNENCYDFSNIKVEMVKEKGLFYNAKIYVTGIDSAKVKAYKESKTNVRFYLYISDKQEENIPTTWDELKKNVVVGYNIEYPIVCELALLDNDKMTVDLYSDEIYARVGDTLYATIFETYYDEEKHETKTHVTTTNANIRFDKPAQEAYGNKIKFTIHDISTYIADNEPSSMFQKRMIMQVAKVEDISKYTEENKYENLMQTLKNTTAFVYNSEIDFNRNGSGGTNAWNSDLSVEKIKFEPNSYYFIYAKLLSEDGKYKEVEDIELYKTLGTSEVISLQPVTEFDERQDEPKGNYVTTNPTNTTGDDSIATKKIPQTGATPVFAIVLGSVVLVAGVFVVANKKYRDIQ